MSRAAFLVAYPEFDDPQDYALIDAKLQEAQRRISQAVWGSLYTDGLFLYAAHLISQSPFGMQARRENKADTTYKASFEELEQLVAGGGVLL